jgi:hypothetical protein
MIFAKPLNVQAYPAKNPGWIGPVFAKSAVSAAVSSGSGPIGPCPQLSSSPPAMVRTAALHASESPCQKGFA